jgi:flagellar basal-body rod protein FlgB
MAAIDPLLGIHPQALQIQRRRMELLAANLANADTPGYQARDLDFNAALDQAMNAAAQGTSGAEGADAALRYRVALQPSTDGNTVDVQVEQAQFTDAALHYQASLSFLDGKLKSLLTAITGE